MANKNPFYSQVDSSVATDLDSRKAMYGRDQKNTADHEFMYRKLPYLIVKSMDENVELITTETVEGYGTGQRQTVYDTNTVVSEINKRTFPLPGTGFKDTYDINPDSRNLPGPALQSCTITNQGRYGSTRKATVKFTCFRRGDMNRLIEAFMKPRKKVSIEYGFANQTGWSTRKGKLIGYVYNFNWSLRTEDGGYDCSLDILGPGAFAKGMNTNSMGKQSGLIRIKSGKDFLNIAVGGAMGRLVTDIVNFKELISPTGETLAGGTFAGGKPEEYVQWLRNSADGKKMAYGAVWSPTQAISVGASPGQYFKKGPEGETILYAASIIPDDGIENDDSYSTKKANEAHDGEGPISALVKDSSYDFYVNLKYIVDVLINTVILANSQNITFGQLLRGRSFAFQCNNKCSFSQLPSEFCTSDPTRVVLPGNNYGRYMLPSGGKKGIFFPAAYNSGISCIYNVPNLGATTIDFSKILINVEILDRIFKSHEKKEYFPVLDFLDEIFEEISSGTGSAIRPTCIIPDEKKAGEQSAVIKIIDTNFTVPYIEKDGSIQTESEPIPYNFESFSKSSILRDISMDLKLPSKLMTALYVGGSSSISATNQKIANFFDIAVTEEEADEAPEMSDEDKRKAALATLDIQEMYMVIEVERDGMTTTRTYWYYDTKAKADASGIDGYYPNPSKVYVDLKKTGTGKIQNGKGYSALRTQPTHRDITTADQEIHQQMALAAITTDFASIKLLINKWGPTPDITRTTDTLINRLCRDGAEAMSKPWNKRIMLPLSLKVTIDGCEGLRFGNLITSRWLPNRYFDSNQNPKICFMITNVTHNITNTEWTTELETQCRINTFKV